MRRFAVLSVAVLTLAACGDDQPTPAATEGSSLHVTGKQVQGPAYWAGLSPDGNTLLYNMDGLCVRDVEGSDERCLDTDGLFAGSASWSPDGGKVAMTETIFLGMEPDIWSVDLASGEPSNLTDDGVEPKEWTEAPPFQLPEGSVVDLFPSWSADGERIRFFRAESDGIALMSTPADGGEPTRLGAIRTDWLKLQAVAWSEDSIAWMSGKPDDSDSEVWVADISGGQPNKVLDGPYRVLSFSSDGAFLPADQLERDGEAKVGAARVVPTGGGDPVPVASGDVQYPTWGPDGHAIAFVDKAVKVVDKPGDKPRVLYQGSKLGAADHRNLDWAPGAILVTSGQNAPLVLRTDG